MKLKVKLLTPTAKAPKRATEGSAGYDLYVDTIRDYPQFGGYLVDTGVSVRIPDGYAGKVYIRSSMSMKGYSLLNNVGIIDSDYRGEIALLVKTIYKPKVDTPIAQLVITKIETPDVEIVEELSPTERSEGGFGSTDEEPYSPGKFIGTTEDDVLSTFTETRVNNELRKLGITITLDDLKIRMSKPSTRHLTNPKDIAYQIKDQLSSEYGVIN